MKKNDIIRLTIEDISDEGLGIGHAEGMAVFVKDAVVGDTVLARIVKEKKHYAFARVEEIEKPGSDRVIPPCPVARSCGGCQIQEMDMEAQLRLKDKKVRNNLERIGGFRIEGDRIYTGGRLAGGQCGKNLSGIKDSASADKFTDKAGSYGNIYHIKGMKDPWGYRNKAQFPIGTDRSGKPVAGFYAGRTHSIIDNHRCLIGIDDNRYILEAVLGWMKKYHVTAYDEATGAGLVRHVMTRAGFATGQMMVVIVATKNHLPHEEALVGAILNTENSEMAEGAHVPAIEPEKDRPSDRRFRITGIVLNCNSEKTNVILGKENRVIWGRDYIEDRIGDLTFRISPGSFYQVNPVQTRVLYEKALEFAGLTGTEKVWDLYCGIGTISLFLAGSASSVTGVEIVPDAIKNAEDNARRNNIDNCRFICGKAEEVVDSLDRADVIIVDPPRKGLDAAVTDAILRSAPDRVVYVSCDSATLARDLRVLADGGYVIRKVQPVDMFPHTVHVECVALLCKRPKSYVTLDVDMDDYYRIKGRWHNN